VPEAAVDEDGDPESDERDVGPAEDRGRVGAITSDPEPPEFRAKPTLRARVACPVRAHDPRRGCEPRNWRASVADVRRRPRTTGQSG
jgi:hypothetical protein